MLPTTGTSERRLGGKKKKKLVKRPLTNLKDSGNFIPPSHVCIIEHPLILRTNVMHPQKYGKSRVEFNARRRNEKKTEIYIYKGNSSKSSREFKAIIREEAKVTRKATWL